jgi:surfeit locus 1 family protein
MARAILWPTIAMLVVLALLLTLGTWQLFRKGEKEALIATVSARAHGAAVSLPPRHDWPQLDLEALDYQKVRLTGAFQPAERHVYTILPETRGRAAQPGWWVYVRLVLAEGGSVFVNRGFVPYAQKELSSRPASVTPIGTVNIEGLVRRPEGRGSFTNTDDPARNIFYARDPALFARSLAVDDVAPFTVEQTTPNATDLPLAGQTRVTFPNRHLEYALTWYGLAATLVAIWGVFVAGRLRGRRDDVAG